MHCLSEISRVSYYALEAYVADAWMGSDVWRLQLHCGLRCFEEVIGTGFAWTCNVICSVF